MTYDGASGTILVSILHIIVTKKELLSVSMPQEEKSTTVDCLAVHSHWTKTSHVVADDLPVVTDVAATLVTEPRYFLSIAQW